MARRFTLRQLEYLVAVGELGSIVQASERVNVSAPSISAAITQLEREFGIQLFIRRHAQGLSPTPGGRRFMKQAKLLLDQADLLHDLAGDIAAQPSGPINVGCLVTLAPLVLASLRKSFEAEFPQSRIVQRVENQAKLLELLQVAEIDVAITYDLEIPKGIAFEPLTTLPPNVLLPAGHPLSKRRSISIDELREHPMVLLDLPMSREYFLSMFVAGGVRPTIVERTRELPVLYSMVANGFGYALLNIRPRMALAPDGEELVTVPLEGGYRPLTLGLAAARSERETRILAAFRNHCRARISGASIPGMAPH